jgi:purine-binding chemotaxis protein CheW
MIFHVGQLRVAVPLVKLHRVLRWDESHQVEPYAGQPGWIHGALYHRKRFVRVVDTAELVLPANHRPPLEERRQGKLLIVGDGSWALACQEVGEVFRLTPDQVQWRSAYGRRRWLAGTVSERLCALLDTDEFAQLLENEDDVESALASSLDPGQTVSMSSNKTDLR